jgi:hypothetical protein
MDTATKHMLVTSFCFSACATSLIGALIIGERTGPCSEPLNIITVLGLLWAAGASLFVGLGRILKQPGMALWGGILLACDAVFALVVAASPQLHLINFAVVLWILLVTTIGYVTWRVTKLVRDRTFTVSDLIFITTLIAAALGLIVCMTTQPW